jgi:maltose alpha-D-glucosyltransferase/alpha-amylase
VNLPNGIKDFFEPSVLHWLEHDVLPGYLRQRRWFASKDKAIDSVRLMNLDVFQLGANAILLSEISIKPDGTGERYQLPLALHVHGEPESRYVTQLKLADVQFAGGPADLTDGFALDFFPFGLLSATRNDTTIEIENGELLCLSSAGLKGLDVPPNAGIRRISAEQSNSSLIIDDQIIMKLIRRIMYGINPEVEMVRYLSEHRYANTPPLLGEVRRIDRDGRAYSMVVMQKFVPNQGDAWDYTLNFIKDHQNDLSDYAIFVAVTGKRLAQLHEVLAKPTEDDAFKPELASLLDTKRWSDGAIEQLQLAYAALTDMDVLDETAIRECNFVLAHRAKVLALIPRLAEMAVGSLMTRVHGDFHLGQVLVAGEDAFIIDFEGEPAKPLDIRRAKTSPIRDVAGLLRSLHYAASVSAMVPETFVDQMSSVFLNAYREIEHAAERRWVVDDRQEIALLYLFLLEKSAYEICYEAANRPTWLPIPLRGLAEIIPRALQLTSETKNV